MDRTFRDQLAEKVFQALTLCTYALTAAIVLALLYRSSAILSTKPLRELLFSSTWLPMQNEFGFLPFIAGTLWVTLLAMILAVPVCILCAVHLCEYAAPRFREAASSLLDILAGIPSVVYGLWGIIMIVPVAGGYCVMSAGIVLAIMVIPIIISVLLEVFKTVPGELKDAALSLGATKWQMIKHVLLRRSVPGIAAAVILGFSRAFGETMAVMMVAGNVVQVPHSVFDAAYPLPALIANNYGEMMSIPLYDSALLFAALLLLMIVLIFNFLARAVLYRLGAAR